MGKIIKKVVLTGGPCCGKTTGCCRIPGLLDVLGWKTIVVPEAATETKLSGVLPGMMYPQYFQTGIIMNQMAKERVARYYAAHVPEDKVLILCDRGILDSRAYSNTEEEFLAALHSNGTNLVVARDSYDGVILMESAANGAEEFYSCENNPARDESLELARELDYKVRDAWVGHPHLRFVGNKGITFEQKIDKVTAEICSLLGEPVPYEIERSFLIEMPDIRAIRGYATVWKVDIQQFYLVSRGETERRIRRRGENGKYLYFYTEKEGGVKSQRIERERRITEKEFLDFQREIDTSLKPIYKERYCFLWESTYYELDVYPFWNDKAILEVEMSTKDQQVVIPSFVKVIKEVTEDKRYNNYYLAKGVML